MCIRDSIKASITTERAGSSCYERSPLGAGTGDGGDTALALCVWLGHLREVRPVYFIHECHKNLPMRPFVFFLEDVYVLSFFDDIDGTHCGWPVNRRGRRYIWGVRRDWALAVSTTDFLSRISCGLALTGADLFVAPVDDVQAELSECLKRRRCNPQGKVQMLNVGRACMPLA